MDMVFSQNKDPDLIVREQGWELITNPAVISEAVKKVHAAEASVFTEAAGAADNPKRRKTLTAFLVGKVLAATNGRADPEIAGRQVEELIAKS